MTSRIPDTQHNKRSEKRKVTRMGRSASSSSKEQPGFFRTDRVTHLTKLICAWGKFPGSLKHTTTILIHKKGEIDELKNHRPISLLSVFSKIVEKYMASTINWHLETNRILSNRQCNFRKKKGTQDALYFSLKTRWRSCQ